MDIDDIKIGDYILVKLHEREFNQDDARYGLKENVPYEVKEKGTNDDVLIWNKTRYAYFIASSIEKVLIKEENPEYFL